MDDIGCTRSIHTRRRPRWAGRGAKRLCGPRAIADNSSVHLVLAPEVAAARAFGRPIVALESTIIAHGLPWPDNLAIARELEAAVRAAGGVPATIAVVEGRPQIGLTGEALAHLAEHGRRFVKAGATDLAVHVARGGSAATTASATAVLAARAGIRVFATGGIGGVHRGDTGDVSPARKRHAGGKLATGAAFDVVCVG